MATARLNIDILREALGASAEEIVDRLWELGFEPELGEELEIDVTPDRPDLFSTYGVLRMLKGFFGVERKKLVTYPSDYQVVIQDVPVRPHAVFLVAKDVKIGEPELEDLIQLQEKIHTTYGRRRRKASIGFYRLDEIAFPVKYTARPPEEISFVPLDFSEEMNGLEILEKHPKGIEYGEIIKSAKRWPVLVDAEGKVLSLPPIINAEGIGRVTPGTKDVFVDVTGTCPRTVRKVLEIISMVLQEMGGKVFRVNLLPEGDEEPKSEYVQRRVRKAYVEQVMGIKMDTAKIAELLRAMDYKIINISDHEVVVGVPPYRADILHEIDIVDDVLRAYGINKLSPEFPRVPTIGKVSSKTRRMEALARLMVGYGFSEAYTFALTTRERQFEKMGIKGRAIELKDVKSGAEIVRVWLLPELLEALRLNKTEKKPIKLFEVSYIVLPDEWWENKPHLAALIYDSSANFTAIRRILDGVIRYLGINVEYRPVDHPSFLPGRAAEIVVDGKGIGVVGELHPRVIEAFDLELPVAAFELDLSKAI